MISLQRYTDKVRRRHSTYSNIIQNFRHLLKCSSLFFHARRSGYSWRGIHVGLVWCYQHEAVPEHTETPLLHESSDNVPGSHCHTQMQLATLPPTSAAAREHSWRTYQVQPWLGNDSLPSDWGGTWSIDNCTRCSLACLPHLTHF